MTQVEVIIIEIGDDEILLEKCIETILKKVIGFEAFLKNSDETTEKVKKEVDKHALQLTEVVSIGNRYYLEMGINGEIRAISVEEMFIFVSHGGFLLKGKDFLKAVFSEE